MLAFSDHPLVAAQDFDHLDGLVASHARLQWGIGFKFFMDGVSEVTTTIGGVVAAEWRPWRNKRHAATKRELAGVVAAKRQSKRQSDEGPTGKWGWGWGRRQP